MRVIGNDCSPGLFQYDGNSRPNAARSAGNNCDASHATPPAILIAARSAFNANGNSHAATNTHGGNSLLRISALHLVEQRFENASARGANRMPDLNRASIDIDFRAIPGER